MKLWLILFIIVLGLLLISAAILRHQTNAIEESVQWNPAKADGQRIPVIVELFTSEGCSSCPSADEVLARLERIQPVAGAEIIALGEHVDYWNYIGWTDPFSSPVFSNRQNSYARAFNNTDVYTPQMVVDGQVQFVGSKMNKALEAIANAARAPKAKVQITPTPGINSDTYSFQVRATDLPAISAGETAEVVLAITESNLQSKVSRGDNAGRRLSHGTVVRQLDIISSTQARQGKPLTAASSMTVRNDWQRDKLLAVAFVQQRKSRKVIGAAAARLVNFQTPNTK
ncbi:MAG: DUF1223 domain-containing protein [Acidobacteria bacterium]|nr:DUF1223 domain-containing protein [Acidobacteriota bacterium]